MITKLKRGFKMATVKRERLRHKERLLLLQIEETRERIDKIIKEEERKQQLFNERYKLIIS